MTRSPDDEAEFPIARRDAPIPEGFEPVPEATAIRIIDCGDPNCTHAHVVLIDAQGNAIAQATVSMPMIADMYRIIRGKMP